VVVQLHPGIALEWLITFLSAGGLTNAYYFSITWPTWGYDMRHLGVVETGDALVTPTTDTACQIRPKVYCHGSPCPLDVDHFMYLPE
jgi:hypothetical protein